MKNEVIRRSLIGIPSGVLISMIVTIGISFIIGDGAYHAVVPGLSADMGSEINAVTVQTVLSMLYGAVFAGSSVIWEYDWSILKMTVVHFLIVSLATLPVAYLLRWMDRSIKGAVIYFGIFIAIYAVIWFTQFYIAGKKVRELNRGINKTRQ